MAANVLVAYSEIKESAYIILNRVNSRKMISKVGVSLNHLFIFKLLYLWNPVILNHLGLIIYGILRAAILLKVLININFMLVPIACENNEIKTHPKRTFFDRIRPFVLFCLKKTVFHLFALQLCKKNKFKNFKKCGLKTLDGIIQTDRSRVKTMWPACLQLDEGS